MASKEAAKKSLFVVYAPDYTDPDGLSRRLAVRTEHLEKAKPLIDEGILKVGGAMITPESFDTENRKMAGSVMIFAADNIKVVRELILHDIYYTANVWDREKLVIMPFVAATPL